MRMARESARHRDRTIGCQAQVGTTPRAGGRAEALCDRFSEPTTFGHAAGLVPTLRAGPDLAIYVGNPSRLRLLRARQRLQRSMPGRRQRARGARSAHPARAAAPTPQSGGCPCHREASAGRAAGRAFRYGFHRTQPPLARVLSCAHARFSIAERRIELGAQQRSLSCFRMAARHDKTHFPRLEVPRTRKLAILIRTDGLGPDGVGASAGPSNWTWTKVPTRML
jgi:hypothetical protein